MKSLPVTYPILAVLAAMAHLSGGDELSDSDVLELEVVVVDSTSVHADDGSKVASLSLVHFRRGGAASFRVIQDYDPQSQEQTIVLRRPTARMHLRGLGLDGPIADLGSIHFDMEGSVLWLAIARTRKQTSAIEIHAVPVSIDRERATIRVAEDEIRFIRRSFTHPRGEVDRVTQVKIGVSEECDFNDCVELTVFRTDEAAEPYVLTIERERMKARRVRTD